MTPVAVSARAGQPLKATAPDLPPWVVVLLLCTGQVLIWSIATGLLYSAPEIDSAEQFVWSFSVEQGYWKHPPLPSWIMHALLVWLAPSVELPFVATQVSIALALALTWRLGCEFMSTRRSLIAMVLTSLVAYHNMGGDSFNHTTVMLPFQAATVLFFYLATRRGGMHLWALTGLFAGFAMLAKYAALIPIAGLLIYVLVDRALHKRRVAIGLTVAAMVFALVLLPHALWLERADYTTLRYALSVAHPAAGFASNVGGLADFLLTQMIRVLPLLLALVYILRSRPEQKIAASAAAPAIASRDRLFLWSAALAPLALTLLFGLLTGTELQSRWGANGFLFSGLLAMALWKRAENAQTLHRTMMFAVAAHVLFAATMALSKTVLADHLQYRTRANFPGAVLAREAMQTWTAHTRTPLRIVVSDIWLGGNMVANRTERIAVLIDGMESKSPWVNDQAVKDCGALVLDNLTDASTATPSEALDALMARASFTGTWNLPWAVTQEQATRQDTGVVRWGIIEPRNPQACQIG